MPVEYTLICGQIRSPITISPTSVSNVKPSITQVPHPYAPFMKNQMKQPAFIVPRTTHLQHVLLKKIKNHIDAPIALKMTIPQSKKKLTVTPLPVNYALRTLKKLKGLK